MNRLTYSRPDDGYLTLWPPRALGTDFNRALSKAKGGLAPRAASGFALARIGKSEHLPPGIDLNDARIFATQWTDLEPVTICEAVCIGLNDTIVFRKVERLQSCKRFDEIPENGELVVAGEIMTKAAPDPKMPRGFDQMADRLTRGLTYEDRKWFKPYLKKYMNVIAVDWKRLTDIRQRKIWSKAEKVIQKADVRRLTKPWVQRVTLDMTAVSKGTKRHLREHYLPRLNTALTQPDQRAIKQIGKQQGWFLRDQMGKRSEALTKHGERIVKRGLKDGWGREQIAKELEKKVSGMWGKYGRNYSMAVSSVALSRARTASEIRSYQQSSIEQLEIQAILDEVTTEQCFLAGTKILTPKGEIEIERIITGQEVITGTGKTHKVTATMQHETNEYFTLTLSSGRLIMVTENHPVLTAKGWLKCGELTIGDSVAKKKRPNKVDNANLQTLPKRIRNHAHLCEQGTNEVLFSGVFPDSQKEGIHEGRPDKDMYFMREEVHGQSRFRDSWEGQKALLYGVPQATSSPNMSDVRESIYRQSLGGQKVKEKLLFNSMQRKKPIDDQCRNGRVGSVHRCGVGVEEGSPDREVFNRLCSSLSEEFSNRSGWGLLARESVNGRRVSDEVSGEERKANSRRWAVPDKNGRAPAQEGSNEIDADTLRVEDYLRGINEWDTVVSIERRTGDETTVYNLEIETDHTYIAEGVVVHNCRFLDGQVISVDECADLMERGANVSKPEDIRTVNPFINVRKDTETGQRSLFTTTGTKLAEITRPGYGTRDDRGEFKANMFGNQLPKGGNVGPPPYHHL